MKLEVEAAPHYDGHRFFEGYRIPLRVIHVESSRTFPRHRHDFGELVVVTGGSGTHILNGRASLLGPGDVCFIPRGAFHEYSETRSLDYINVIFREEELPGWGNAPGSLPAWSRDEAAPVPWPPFRLTTFALREAMALISRIDQELYSRRECYPEMAGACFVQLWYFLLRNCRGDNQPEGEDAESRIRRIIKFLREESGPEISPSDMAREAGTGLRNFHRIFRTLTGLPPVTFINRLRIEKSCELLVNTEKTVTQIAGLVGYDDSNYYGRQFKAFLGCSPRQFRESGGTEAGFKKPGIPDDIPSA